MTEENKSLLKNKLINSLANIYIYSTCLSILTGCKVNMQTELTSKQPDNIIQDVGTTSSEDDQDSEEVVLDNLIL